jgi:hypothetical protein
MINSTKSFLTALVGIAVVGAALSYNPAPAEAGRKSCLYQAYDRFAKRTVHQIKGHATAARQSWACNRARRRCLRDLRKAWDRGMAQRAGCVRFVGRVPQL